ncbi:MAG: multiprotein bridging factor aMBF1 [Candidatus Woesearchaeota archaeon]
MQCEICGKETEKIYLTMIEGSKLKVCKECSSLGNVISVVNEDPKNKDFVVVKKPKEPAAEKEFFIRSDYGNIIRKARENSNMKIEEFAKKLSLKESFVHKLETFQAEPDLETAKRLERLLHVKLIEEVQEVPIGKKEEPREELTFGDLVKVKEKSRKNTDKKD